MIYPYTALLHGVMAVLCLLSLIYLFYRKRDANSEGIQSYFNWFLFFFLYNISLVLPLLIFDRLTPATGFFYDLALLFLAFGAWYAFRVALSLLFGDGGRQNLLSSLFVVGVLLAVSLHFIFTEVPRGSLDGKWVFWYSGRSVTNFYVLFMFLAGWTFAAAFFKGIFYAEAVLLKLRSLCFALAGAILPIAAFYYFGAEKISNIYLAFLFSILGLLFLAFGNIAVGLFRKSAPAGM